MSFGMNSQSQQSSGSSWSQSMAKQNVFEGDRFKDFYGGVADFAQNGFQQAQGRAMSGIGNAMDQMGQFANPINPAMQAQVGQLGQDIGRQFQQEIMPGLRGSAVEVGGLGGSRDMMARGVAGQGAMDAFQRGTTDIYSNAYNQAQGAAMNQAGLASMYAQQAWSPFAMQGQLMGDPTTLSNAWSHSAAQQQSSGSGSGFSFGIV